MAEAGIVAFGPSLIDICAQLPDETLTACRRLLGLDADGWRRLDDHRQVRELLAVLAGRVVDEGDELGAVAQSPALRLGAGSSTFGMLTAMPAPLRHSARYMSVSAMTDGRLDPMSALFTSAVEAAGVRHDYAVASGHNPVGFVLSGRSDPEKVMATYSGVASLFEGHDLTTRPPELVIVDAYELVGGRMAAFLHSVIESGRWRIALSLGNSALLAGPLADRIRGYLQAAKLHVLCGNAEEYRALLPDHPGRLDAPGDFRDHPVRGSVRYALMTFGSQGMAAHWAGAFVTAPAEVVDPTAIVNTGGAGDAVAGAFCAGMLLDAAPDETLRGAAVLAQRAIMVLHPHLLPRSTAAAGVASEDRSEGSRLPAG